MITAVFAFVGAMIGAVFINYVLHAPNKQLEEYEYHNSKHNEPTD